MTKVVFCFAGTGDPGDGTASNMEADNNFNDDVIRIYVRGCQHENVGGGPVFPDLEIVANKIRSAFSDDKTLDLEKLKQELGVGENGAICRIGGPQHLQKPQIESIGLQGFSRGAVTTFAVAKKLNPLGIPMDIVANQPVPGPGIFAKYNDLSDCDNIRSATVLLATHNLENGFVHNQFFQQMVTKFPPTTQAQNWLMPHQQHLEWFSHNIVPYHVSKQLIQAGYATPSKTYSPKTRRIEDVDYDSLISQAYESNICFTPKKFAQTIFSKGEPLITKDPIYLRMVQRDAQSVLNKCEVFNTTVRDEQASAIVAISKQTALSAQEQEKLIKFIVTDSDKAKKLTQIVNQTTEVTGYLSFITNTGGSTKSTAIKTHAAAYHQAVFMNTYDYLQKENPSKAEGIEFCKQLDKAQSKFAESALSIDRGVMRKAMSIVSNFILHVTGLALIVNSIHKYTTGNWFVFSQTRSESEVAKVTTSAKTLATPEGPTTHAEKSPSLTEKSIRLDASGTEPVSLTEKTIDLKERLNASKPQAEDPPSPTEGLGIK